MNTNDAILMLQRLKQNKKVKQETNTQKTMAESLTGTKNILVGTMSDLADLMMKNQQSVKVVNFPSLKTQEKLLKQINDNLLILIKQQKKCNCSDK